jgi:signal peptidase
MRVLGSSLRFLATALLTAVVLTAGLAAGGVALGTWRFAVVEGESVGPGLQPGDVVLLRPVSADQLHPGQVLSVPGPAGASVPSLQQVVSVGAVGGHLVVRSVADDTAGSPRAPRRTVLATMSTAWVATARVPLDRLGMGTGLADPHRRALVLDATGAAVVMAAALLAIGQLRRRRRVASAGAPTTPAPFSEEWWRLLARS